VQGYEESKTEEHGSRCQLELRKIELPAELQEDFRALIREAYEGMNISTIKDAYNKRHPGPKLDTQEFGFHNFSAAMRSIEGLTLEQRYDKNFRPTTFLVFFTDSLVHKAFLEEDSRGSCAHAADPVAKAVLRAASPTEWRRSQEQAEQPAQETLQVNQDSVARYVPPHRKSVACCSDRVPSPTQWRRSQAQAEQPAQETPQVNQDSVARYVPPHQKSVAQCSDRVASPTQWRRSLAQAEPPAQEMRQVNQDSVARYVPPHQKSVARCSDRVASPTQWRRPQAQAEQPAQETRQVNQDSVARYVPPHQKSVARCSDKTHNKTDTLPAGQEAVTDTAEHVIWLDSCGWTSGDFTTSQAWNYNMTWGPDEVSLAVEKGESLHVSKIEGDWANAASASSGRNGWMPSAILQHVVHTSIAPFSGGPGYMKIEKGDRLAVFHRDADWVYGACLRGRTPQQAPGKESSLVHSEQVHAEGWFPSSCTEWPVRA